MKATAVVCAAVTIALASRAMSGQRQPASTGVLDEHPAIQYAMRPTTDRVAKLRQALTRGERTLVRDARTGFVLPVLQALGVPFESQLLVFSKTGVQSAYTGPRNPRAIFFDQSVVVAYVPGAPVIELAAHDPQQGVVFYTIDQSAAAPVPVRHVGCMSCHVTASTLEAPGIIARSNAVGDDGNVLREFGSHDVDHRTTHPDRWGGWFVTSEALTPYGQRAHMGNITFAGRETTSNQVFVDFMHSAPETHGYLRASSDIVSLLVFDHQARAINLLTRLNWESRVAASAGPVHTSQTTIAGLVDELADYLLFVGEAPPSVPLEPLPAFVDYLGARTPKDHRGRSFGQLDAVNRLLQYPCSFMVYTDAFDGLLPVVRDAVYARMLDILSGRDSRSAYAHMTAADRQAIVEILRETKPDFPRSPAAALHPH